MNTLIGLAGDWHGNRGWARLRLLDFAVAGVKTIFHLGDFGIFPGNSARKYIHRLNGILRENDQELLVTLGNHEDYVQVSAMKPVTDGQWAGITVYNPDYPHIKYFKRGVAFEIEGVKFLSVGGANSIDRFYPHRIPNISWWEGEQISLGDVYRSVESAGDGVDVMLAHDAPAEVPLFDGHKSGAGSSNWSFSDLEYAQKSREALSQIIPVARPKMYLHGHYHFFADLDVPLKDWEGNEYTMRSICLDMDDNPNNIGVLELPTKEFTVLPYQHFPQRS
jgi:hypothetical protein